MKIISERTRQDLAMVGSFLDGAQDMMNCGYRPEWLNAMVWDVYKRACVHEKEKPKWSKKAASFSLMHKVKEVVFIIKTLLVYDNSWEAQGIDKYGKYYKVSGQILDGKRDQSHAINIKKVVSW